MQKLIQSDTDLFSYLKPLHLIIEPQGDKGGLYLGNLAAARNIIKLQELNIGAVLTVAYGGQTNYPEYINNLYIEADDDPFYDLSQHFSATNEFIFQNLKQTNVLVHCLAGVSRSATVTIAYLMKHQKKRYDIALDYVRERRQIIQPNEGFLDQLKQYEVQLSFEPNQS